MKIKMETQDSIKIISSSTKKIRIMGNFKSQITSQIIAGQTQLFQVNNSNVNLKSGFNFSIYTYFYPTWAIEYLTIPDIESQALLVYVAYPTAQIQISIALWTVMIGIISICSPRI